MKILSILVALFAASALAQSPWIPAPQTQQDWMSWIWLERHAANVNNSAINGPNINVVFYGDSITEAWNYPTYNWGLEVWNRVFAPLGAVNYAISGDAVQHVLWRILNGEVDDISPKVIVLKIGTNNVWDNTDFMVEIARGISAVVTTLRNKLPSTKILLLGVLPRQNERMTSLVEDINRRISIHDNGNSVRFLNMRDAFYNSTSGSLYEELYDPDLLHLDTPGYIKWEETMRDLFFEMYNSS